MIMSVKICISFIVVIIIMGFWMYTFQKVKKGNGSKETQAMHIISEILIAVSEMETIKEKIIIGESYRANNILFHIWILFAIYDIFILVRKD